jgi:integrase
VLGHLAVADLTAAKLRRWLSDVAATPAQTRSKRGEPQYRPESVNEEDVRRRRATANRVLTTLKAILNHCHDEGHIGSRDAWGRKLKPFRGVGRARLRYLTIEEAKKLIASADADFAPLVRAALETGCRYGELARLEVADFDGKTISVGRSKTGAARKVVLTNQGTEFFKNHCTGRSGLMFRKKGEPWVKSAQDIPMREACQRAGIVPRVSFHTLRHTWASLAAMANVPLMIISRNLGHTTTAMVEKHYGHLSPGYVAEEINRGAPRFE